MKTQISIVVTLVSVIFVANHLALASPSDLPGSRFAPVPALQRARSSQTAGDSGKDHRFVDATRQHHRRDGHHQSDTGRSPLPTFTRTFDYNGIAYKEQFVGADPARKPQTTVIRTLIVPVRVDFGNGVVLDPSVDVRAGHTWMDWTLHSPIFTNTEYFAGGVSIGKHQIGDEMMREGFWSEGGSDRRYHTILAPVVLPAQTIVVPPGKGSATEMILDDQWLDDRTHEMVSHLNPDPATLVVLVVGHELRTELSLGWHESAILPTRPYGPEQTYIVAMEGYDISQGAHDPGVGIILEHEVAEWFSDPFITNQVPPWILYQSFGASLMEVGDPFDSWLGDNAFLVTTTEGRDYVVQDLAFFDWFTRRSLSRSLNGWYTLNGKTSSSLAPYDMNRFEIQQFDYPGAIATGLNGISSRGDMVGDFYDNDGVEHGLLVVNGKAQQFDVPGASATYPNSINSSGKVVGYYADETGYYHPFAYVAGTFQVLSFSQDGLLYPNAINDAGDIAGDFYPYSGPVFSEGFLIHNGNLQTLLPLGAFNASFTAVSQFGALGGEIDSDGDGNNETAFTGRVGHFEMADYAGPLPGNGITWVHGVTDSNLITGTYLDQAGALNGFYRINGIWSRICYGYATEIYGVNANGIAVGYVLSGNRGVYVHAIIVRPKHPH